MLRRIVPAGLAVALFLFGAPRAEASLILAATFGGVDVCAADQDIPCSWGTQLPDTNPAPNQLSLGSTSTPITVGGLELFGSLYTATAGSTNVLATSSLSIRNTTTQTVFANFGVGATGFTGPANTAAVTASGTWLNAPFGSSINMGFYDDPDNGQGATTPDTVPGNIVAGFFIPSGLTAFSPTSSATVNDPALFSMTLAYDLTLSPGGTLLGLTTTELKTFEAAQVVPEPASLTLFGLGFGVLGYTLRKRLGKPKDGSPPGISPRK